METKKIILKYALQNAIRFDGKASPGNIISKVIGENPDLKTKAKELMKEIQETVKKVNSLSIDEQIKELKKIAPELLEEKKVEKKELKELPNVGEKIVLRLCPSPSGPLHIGHAYTYGLNYLYKQKYNAKLIFRLEDTNPDNIDPDAYTLIKEDFDWLTDNGIDETYIQSERMELYYAFALRLIEENHAYVCTCDSEKFKELIIKKKNCPCRNLPVEKQIERWEKMLREYDEGAAVLRFKSDIKDPNPAMRDFPLMRINTSEHPHVGYKYRVWPLMNFAVAIDDMDMGVTHAIRGKDHADNAKRQQMIHKALQANSPTTVIVGRINFKGFDLSTTQTKLKIKEGKYTGWDDIRLPFLKALRRRGYQAAALRKFALSLGVTQTDKTVETDEFFKTLNAFNKEIIDPIANRYFCIINPVKIKIENAPDMELDLDLHPQKRKGGRKIYTTDVFYIEKEDLKSISDGELVRLMGCLNFIKKGNKFLFVSKEYEKFKDAGKKQIHWLPAFNNTKITIKTETNDDIECLAEKNVENVKVDEIVQFERFGFCRCDSKNYFWFTHK